MITLHFTAVFYPKAQEGKDSRFFICLWKNSICRVRKGQILSGWLFKWLSIGGEAGRQRLCMQTHSDPNGLIQPILKSWAELSDMPWQTPQINRSVWRLSAGLSSVRRSCSASSHQQQFFFQKKWDRGTVVIATAEPLGSPSSTAELPWVGGCSSPTREGLRLWQQNIPSLLLKKKQCKNQREVGKPRS